MSANVARKREGVRESKRAARKEGAHKFFYSADCPAESIPEIFLLSLGVDSSYVPELIVKFGEVWDGRGGNLEETVGAAGEVAVCS